MFTQKNQHELGLKAGDKAYFLVDETYGVFDLVTIVGDCKEGHGYSAISPWWAENYPPREDSPWTEPGEPPEVPGSIHTCNDTLFKTKREARAETIRLLRKSRKRFAEEQAKLCRSIQYIDYILRKGKC